MYARQERHGEVGGVEDMVYVVILVGRFGDSLTDGVNVWVVDRSARSVVDEIMTTDTEYVRILISRGVYCRRVFVWLAMPFNTEKNCW